MRANHFFGLPLATIPAGSYLSNELGLHDLHGNAAEWTSTERDEKLDPNWETVAGAWRNDRGHIKSSRSGGIAFVGNPAWQDIAVEAMCIKPKARSGDPPAVAICKSQAVIPPTMKRRSFLGTATAFASVQILPASVKGANERLNIAFIGAGGKGWSSIRNLRSDPLVNLLAFADVDERRCQEARKGHPRVPFYRDLRGMLDRHGREIDGVAISTPDHTHHYAAKSCLLAGKPVYLEKPLAHNIAEVRDLMKWEAETGLACQMGNQGHSGSGILLLEAWAKAGIFGEVNEAHAWAGSQHSNEDKRPEPERIPEGLDWDRWLGPAGKVPYSSQYLPGKWRAWFEFGTGTLGDWACHNMDAPYTVFGLDCPSRIELESTGPKKLSFPISARIDFVFPATGARPEFKLHWYQGPVHLPPRPAGFAPETELPKGGTIIPGAETTVIMGTHAGSPRIVPESRFREMMPSLPKPDLKRSDHYRNWLLAIRGEEKCRSNFAYAGRLTETMHFGNIAMHLNRGLTIDPVTRSIVGDDEATAMISHPRPREGWEI